MRNLLLFLVAGLLGAALVVALVRKRRAELPAAGGAAPIAERDVPERAAPERPAGRPGARKEPSEAAAEPVTRAPLPAELAGTIVVLDEQGVEHAGESGILACTLGAGGARTRHEVEVRDGRWSLALARTLPPDATLALRAVLLGPGPAVPAPGQAAELALPADGRIELRLRRRAAPRLAVRARDGRELEEVALYELPLAQRGSPSDALHPGPAVQAGAAGASPVTLASGGLDARVVFARGPGHAWGRIELDPLASEDPLLVLEPAATLALTVASEPANPALELRLLEAAPPHALVLDHPLGDAKSLRLADLRPGRYAVEARHSGRLVGAIEVVLAAGRVTEAVLTTAAPPSEPVPFEGVLVVPEAWQLEDFILEFLLQGPFDGASLTRGSFELRRSEMTLEPGSRERFRWKAPAARPARYRVALHPAPFVTELDTGPAGTREAVIAVPPPCLVSVRALDALGAPLAWSDKLAFAALTPRATALLPTPALAGASAASRELRVPEGRVLFLTSSPQHAPAARLVELGPGTNELLLPLQRKP